MQSPERLKQARRNDLAARRIETFADVLLHRKGGLGTLLGAFLGLDDDDDAEEAPGDDASFAVPGALFGGAQLRDT